MICLFDLHLMIVGCER